MYQQSIRETLARTGYLGTDPYQVEAYMRLEHPTLDGLSREQFDAEVVICAQCVAAAGPEDSAALAASFGLGRAVA